MKFFFLFNTGSKDVLELDKLRGNGNVATSKQGQTKMLLKSSNF